MNFDVATEKSVVEAEIFRDFTVDWHNRGLWPRGIIGKYYWPNNAKCVYTLCAYVCVSLCRCKMTVIRKLAMSSKTEIVMT